MMKQLVLDIRPDAPPTLDNFVAGTNAELLATLSLLASSASARQLPARHVYVWGAPGSGRSHLLRATLAQAQASGRPTHGFGAADIAAVLPETPDAVLAIDDVDQLSAPAQVALFNAFNRSRSNGQTLLLAGPSAPLGLALREDLRTRIGQVVESFVLTPYLVGERIGLHPLAVIFALMAFGQLFGFVGVLVGLPVSAALLVGLREVRQAWFASPVYLGKETPAVVTPPDVDA